MALPLLGPENTAKNCESKIVELISFLCYSYEYIDYFTTTWILLRISRRINREE